MRSAILIVLMVIAVGASLLVHCAACELHVWAVDRMSNADEKKKYQGWFYRYAQKVSRPVLWLENKGWI
jgi:H+/gluconate symporter-like permease